MGSSRLSICYLAISSHLKNLGGMRSYAKSVEDTFPIIPSIRENQWFFLSNSRINRFLSFKELVCPGWSVCQSVASAAKSDYFRWNNVNETILETISLYFIFVYPVESTWNHVNFGQFYYYWHFFFVDTNLWNWAHLSEHFFFNKNSISQKVK